MNTYPLSFEGWLLEYFAIDYSKREKEVTEETKQIWRDAYQEYLILFERQK